MQSLNHPSIHTYVQPSTIHCTQTPTQIQSINPELEAQLKAVVPHTRVMAVSAMKKINTGELMHRVSAFERV